MTIKSSHVEINGFTVKGAVGEGILATGCTDRLHHRRDHFRNTVTGNDTGGNDPSTVYPQCQASGGVPGDCGEGVRLMGLAHSEIAGNTISSKSGGILLTDEFGPTHGNLISKNVVKNNVFDCGITLPGHNPGAYVNGQLQPDSRRRLQQCHTTEHRRWQRDGRVRSGHWPVRARSWNRDLQQHHRAERRWKATGSAV